jgi:hypothetical protein
VRKTPFEQAVELTRNLYNFAALHVVAEDIGGVWVNRYTSVTYGREEDLRSVPPVVGAKRERHDGHDFLCLRQRLRRNDAEEFVSAAIRRNAQIGADSISYDVEPAITGFRPEKPSRELADASLWNASGWSREHIGIVKEAAGLVLSNSTAWQFDEALGFLRKVIWLPIPLREYPEKLGDLDEFWPTPIEFEVQSTGGAANVEIVRDLLKVTGDRITISGTLIQHDLIAGHVVFNGLGPHSLPIDPDAIDLVLCVDGVPVDAKAHRFLRQISMTFALETGADTSFTVPGAGARPSMTFKVSRPEMQEQNIGSTPKDTIRHKSWAIGRSFRNPTRSVDAERFYDPIVMPDSVQRAFDDLRQFGTGQHRPRVLVADPYALDERALYAIGTIAARFGSVASIEVVSGFRAGNMEVMPEKVRTFRDIWDAFVSSMFPSRSKSAAATKRQETERNAFDAAARVANALAVGFRFYRAERLHDRFLVIGERVWHVGPSFNKIGEQISAIVEISDERVKAELIESLLRFTAGPLLKEAKP